MIKMMSFLFRPRTNEIPLLFECLLIIFSVNFSLNLFALAGSFIKVTVYPKKIILKKITLIVS